MRDAAARHGVPLGVLYAVGLTETGKRGSLQPFALNIDGRAYFGRSVTDAVAQFEAAKRKGARFIDLGCMQINHHFHGAKFPSLTAMLDPLRNVDYATSFLKELKRREGSWTMAVARYNAGPNNNPAQQRYICRVVANMVASGFGDWTSGARSFCSGDPSSTKPVGHVGVRMSARAEAPARP
jgi:soluble lytic murein transglycosylase-like protein